MVVPVSSIMARTVETLPDRFELLVAQPHHFVLVEAVVQLERSSKLRGGILTSRFVGRFDPEQEVGRGKAEAVAGAGGVEPDSFFSASDGFTNCRQRC